MDASIRSGEPLRIIAIGSSSTKGDGATNPAAAYPQRLEAILKDRLPDTPVTVLNKGEGGQEAPDEVARFKRDVFYENPTVVIWQIGTNAVWKDYYLEEVTAAIMRGLERLSKLPVDVVLMDLQYAPALIDLAHKADAERMVSFIDDAARALDVNVFKRFALMRYWVEELNISTDQMISNFDGNQLHQNDWSYNCVAHALADAALEAAARLA
jgi:hypothetical protein